MRTILLVVFMGISIGFSQKNKIPVNGTVSIYYPSESRKKILRETGENNENQRTGKWSFFTRNGKLDYTIDYSGASSFTKKVYFHEETIVSEEHFENGALNGTQTYFNTDGQKLFDYFFSNGQLDSIWKFDSEKEFIVSKIVYHSNLKVKKYEAFFPNGKLESTESNNKNGQRDGLWMENKKTNDGQIYLYEKQEYKDGLLHGEYLYGNEKCIYQDHHYVNNLKHGVCSDFYTNCDLKYQVHYNNGVKTGKGIHYFGNNIVQIEEYWSSKQSHYGSDFYDSCFIYRINGSLDSKSFQKQLSDQELETKNLTYYPSGKLKDIFQNINGKNSGIWKSFYENSVQQAEIPYIDGYINGKMTFWYKNGKKKLEFMVEDDIVIAQKGWDESGKLIPFESPKYRPLYDSEDYYGLHNYLDEESRSLKSGIINDDFGRDEFNSGSNYEKEPVYERDAVFTEGWEQFQERFKELKHFPEAEKVFNEKMLININFVVKADGTASIINLQLYSPRKEPAQIYEVEIKRIFSHLPLWIPAVSDGKNVDQKRIVTVEL